MSGNVCPNNNEDFKTRKILKGKGAGHSPPPRNYNKTLHRHGGQQQKCRSGAVLGAGRELYYLIIRVTLLLLEMLLQQPQQNCRSGAVRSIDWCVPKMKSSRLQQRCRSRVTLLEISPITTIQQRCKQRAVLQQRCRSRVTLLVIFPTTTTTLQAALCDRSIGASPQTHGGQRCCLRRPSLALGLRQRLLPRMRHLPSHQRNRHSAEGLTHEPYVCKS